MGLSWSRVGRFWDICCRSLTGRVETMFGVDICWFDAEGSDISVSVVWVEIDLE